jgi:hypothetical protein
MQGLINAVWRDLYQVKHVESVTVTNNAVSDIDSIPQTVQQIIWFLILSH